MRYGYWVCSAFFFGFFYDLVSQVGSLLHFCVSIVPFNFGCGFGVSWDMRILLGPFLFSPLFLYFGLQQGDCYGRQATVYLGSRG